MSIERVHDRAFASCQSMHQINQLHIQLENRITPSEAQSLVQHIGETYALPSTVRRWHQLRMRAVTLVSGPPRLGAPRALSRPDRCALALGWSARLSRHLESAGTTEFSSMRRDWVRGGARLYRCTGPRSGSLVIGFTGNARRLMMPTYLLLHYVGSFGADLLILEAPRGRHFSDGVLGFSHDMASTIDWLQGYVPDSGATRAVAVGSSSGALPAILAGLALPLDAVLAVGPTTTRAEVYGPRGSSMDLADLVAHYRTNSGTPATYVMFGEESKSDRLSAEQLLGVVPESVVVPVAGAGHNCLHALLLRGGLAEALQSTVFSARPA